MPHFISLVVVCAMIRLFVAENGFIVQIMRTFGFGVNQNLLNISSAFVPIYILSGIWQNAGWNCIIYLAALAAIDVELYEAARIDGANRWKQTIHVTMPGLSGTIILLLILRIGQLMSVGHEKIILLYNDFIMDRADVISSYVFRRGLVNGDWSFSTAVGLFNSVINFTLVVLANKLSNKVSGKGLW
jgi:putative aldouronate transport system permease protein